MFLGNGEKAELEYKKAIPLSYLSTIYSVLAGVPTVKPGESKNSSKLAS